MRAKVDGRWINVRFWDDPGAQPTSVTTGQLESILAIGPDHLIVVDRPVFAALHRLDCFNETSLEQIEFSVIPKTLEWDRYLPNEPVTLSPALTALGVRRLTTEELNAMVASVSSGT